MDRCSYCGKKVNDDELFEVSNYDADEIEQVCSHCLEHYTKCDQCGMYRPNDTVTYFPETEMHVCNLCHELEFDDAVTDYDIDMEDESWQD